MPPPAVYVNLSIPARAAEAVERGAQGVGLMRAEFLVYRTGRHPLYLLTDPEPQDLVTILGDGLREVAREFYPRPVIYRSLDLRSNELLNLIGGTQFEDVEENPALGCRGVNRSQRDPDIFRAEVAALAAVRADGFDNVELMLPFVRWPEEVAWARGILAESRLVGAEAPQLLMMVETPAAVFLADKFAPLVDGVSIGSNDLSQLVLGLDRDNVAFARRDWDEDDAVIAALRWAIDRYRSLGTPVGICGDAPSRSDSLLRLLIELGLDSISVSVDRLPGLIELLEGRAVAPAEPQKRL